MKIEGPIPNQRIFDEGRIGPFISSGLRIHPVPMHRATAPAPAGRLSLLPRKTG